MAPYPIDLGEVGVVAIGRNEGERLCRCLDAVDPRVGGMVYVDSASTDGSVAEAAKRGVAPIELDMSIPFTAARARNAGLRYLVENSPSLRYVQFVDGDAMLSRDWLAAAVEEMAADARVAVVCGRRREVDRGGSIYNLLADMEWDAPPGEDGSCGGDALVRVSALLEIGGYDEGLIAGEEPDMCARLRERGWKVRRIDAEMTLHDSAMTRFGQWFKRAMRSGYGFAQVHAKNPALYGRERRSSIAWGVVLPVCAGVSALFSGGIGLVSLVAYPVLWLRVLRWRARRDAMSDAALYATFCVLGKIPEAAGVLKYEWNRLRGRRSELIEYK